MAVFFDLHGDVGHRKSNLLEYIGAAKQRSRLEIDEEFLEPDQRSAVLLLDFKLRHFERQHERIELDVFDCHRAAKLIRHRRQDLGLNNVGNQKEPGQGVDQEQRESGDRERDRSKEPTHGASNRYQQLKS